MNSSNRGNRENEIKLLIRPFEFDTVHKVSVHQRKDQVRFPEPGHFSLC